MSLVPTPTPLSFIESLGDNGLELFALFLTMVVSGSISLIIGLCKLKNRDNIDTKGAEIVAIL